MSVPSRDLRPTIIGGGPAGFHAAIQLAELGFKSQIFDESPAIGGAIYRPPSYPRLTERMDTKTRSKIAAYRSLLEQHASSVAFSPGVQILGPVDGTRTLGLLHHGQQFSKQTYDRLIVCTGCFERAQPFPGWTLPGVMTVGGLQVMVKQSGIRPCESAVLVGTGPLLLIAALQLHRAGIHIKGVFESGRRRDLVKNWRGLFKGLDLLAEGLSCLTALQLARIPVQFGWGIVAAKGDDELREVIVAPYDQDWRPRRDQAKRIQVSGLGVEYGFVSRSQLTRLLGLKHFEDEESGWRPESDAWGRTSDERTYVAGDGVGVDGSQVAERQGRLAALACLVDAGVLGQKEAEKLAHLHLEAVKRHQAFRRAFFDFSRLRPGLLDLPDGETLVCRCEAVSRAEVDAAIDEGVRDLTTLKMVTRIGMGDCQGKMCGSFCTDYLRQRTKTADVGQLSPRFPLAPLPFEALSRGEDDATIL